MGWGRDGFRASPSENENGIIRKRKAKNKYVMLGQQEGVETDPILGLSVGVPRMPRGARNEEICLKRQTGVACRMQGCQIEAVRRRTASVWRARAWSPSP